MVRRGMRIRSGFTGVVILAAVATGCSSCEATRPTRRRPRRPPPRPPRVSPTRSRSPRRPGQVIVGSATGDSACEKASPTPSSPGQVGAGGGGGQSANAEVGEHGARGMVKQLPLTHAQRLELQQQMEQARSVVVAVPHREGRRSSGLPPLDRVRAVHRRPLHEHRARDPVRSGASVGVALRRLHSRRQARRPELPRVPPQRTASRVRGPERPLASAQRERRTVHEQHDRRSGRRRNFDSGRVRSARGGHKTLLIDIWMMHAWVVPGFECSWGVFSGECPELGGRVGGTAWDPTS